jgi:hypothetical protein
MPSPNRTTYVDQNFLIYCANDSELHKRALRAVAEGTFNFVLSPWHFYEIGKLEVARREELLKVVREIQPHWIFERFDLQLAEFRRAWGEFWGEPYQAFEPIGSLAYVAAALNDTTPERLARYTVEDYIEIFSGLGTQGIQAGFPMQTQAALANQDAFRSGRVTARKELAISHNYVALQLTCLKNKFLSHAEHDRRLHKLLSDPLIIEKIKFFVDCGGLNVLPAHLVESMLTDEFWTGNAVLNAHRQVDRQHAIPALAYCDRFVTNDINLIKQCLNLKRKAPFRVADTVTYQELLEP